MNQLLASIFPAGGADVRQMRGAMRQQLVSDQAAPLDTAREFLADRSHMVVYDDVPALQSEIERILEFCAAGAGGASDMVEHAESGTDTDMFQSLRGSERLCGEIQRQFCKHISESR